MKNYKQYTEKLWWQNKGKSEDQTSLLFDKNDFYSAVRDRDIQLVLSYITQLPKSFIQEYNYLLIDVINWYSYISDVKEKPYLIKLIKLILSYDVDINQTNRFGNFPLMMAVNHNFEECVRILLSCDNIDINKTNSVGNTSLYISSYKGNFNICKMLIKKGADVNIPNKHGRTPLIIALDYYRFIIIELLLENGADLKLKDESNRDFVNYLRIEIRAIPISELEIWCDIRPELKSMIPDLLSREE